MRVSKACFLPSTIIDLYAQVKASGTITLTDRLLIRTAFIDNALREDELLLIDRIFYSIRRGRIKLVRELTPDLLGQASLELPNLPRRGARDRS